MSWKKGLKRTKERLKNSFGIDIQNSDPTSLPGQLLLEPGPISPASRGVVTSQPPAQNLTTIAQSNPVINTLDPNTHTVALEPPGSTSYNVPPVQNDPKGILHAKSLAWNGLRSLQKVVEMSASAFGPIKLAVEGLGQCVEVFEKASKGHLEYRELQIRIDSLLGDLGGFLGDTTSQDMTASIVNLSMAINQELDLVKNKSTRSATQRYAEAVDDSCEILESYWRIEGHLSRLALNANLKIWGVVDKIKTETRLRGLSPSLFARYDSAASGGVQRGECTAGTRVAEISKLITWAQNRGGEAVFWMNGMAGTGKTTIAYSLCVKLEEQAALGASFFCSRSIPECRNVNLIIPSIAYQLARFSYPFQRALLDILEDDPDAHVRILKKQFESLLTKPLSRVKSTLPVDLVVVIDALDECDGKDSVSQILELLLPQSPDWDLPIRFLVSSRPDPRIYTRMMARLANQFSARLVLHDLDARAVTHDIEIYLRDTLMEVGLTQLQLAALVKRSGVLFIFAATSARYIKEGFEYMEHEERLDMILSTASLAEGSQDREIDNLYGTILQAAFQGYGFGTSIQSKAKMLLYSIICAQEPLSTSSLANLLGFKSNKQVEAILRSLGSVLNIAEKTGLVTTLHISFSDYMQDQLRSSSFYCDPKTTHTRLACLCLDAIRNNDPQFNICRLESSYVSDDSVGGLASRVDQVVPSHLFYACRYWVSHLEPLEEHQETMALLSDFLSARLLLWMEMLNLKGSIHLGPDIMRRAESWIKVNGGSEETNELVHDAWRFILTFASHAISQSTPHIYLSMLPFWPEATPVSRYYRKRVKRWINAQGTSMTRRQLSLLSTWTLDGPVQTACFSPRGLLVAFGCGSSAYIMDGATGSVIVGPLDHDDTVWSVAFSPDGNLIASGSDDHTVRVWDTQNGERVAGPLTGHTEEVNSVCFFPDGAHIVSGSDDCTLRVWNFQSGVAVMTLTGHSQQVCSVCVAPDGKLIASGSDDKTVRIWGAKSGRLVLDPLDKHTGTVRSVCFSPDSKSIVSGSYDKTICVWSAQDGQLIAGPFEGHTHGVSSVSVSPDGRQILSGSFDKTLCLWNIDHTMDPAQIFEGHTSDIYSAAFSPDGTRIVSASDDTTIRIWDPRSPGRADSLLVAHTRGVGSVSFNMDGAHILSGSYDHSIHVWDAQSGEAINTPPLVHPNSVNTICLSNDGTQVASGSFDGTIRTWNSSRKYSATDILVDHGYSVLSVCFSPDGRSLACGSADKTVKIWSLQTPNHSVRSLNGHTDWVRSVCFSPDGNRIASGSDDRTIRVWETHSGQSIIGPLTDHRGWVNAVHFSPNGTCFVSGSKDTTLRIWNAESGNMVLGPLEGHSASVTSVCFSPDSNLIVSGSYDKTIRLWEAHTGLAVGVVLRGHTREIRSVVFSPSGRQVASGSDDSAIRLWDVADVAEMYRSAELSPSHDQTRGSSRFHETWVLQDNGWVVDSRSRLLAWVPPDLHISLLGPRNPLLISRFGSVSLNLESSKLGETWSECYEL